MTFQAGMEMALIAFAIVVTQANCDAILQCILSRGNVNDEILIDKFCIFLIFDF